MQPSSVRAKAVDLLNQLQRRTAESEPQSWMSHIVTFIKQVFDPAFEQQCLPSPQETSKAPATSGKPTCMVHKVAKLALASMADLDGFVIGKQLVQEMCRHSTLKIKKSPPWPLMYEASLLLEANQIEEAKELLQTIDNISTFNDSINYLTELLRQRVYGYIEGQNVRRDSFHRLMKVCEESFGHMQESKRAKMRVDLYRLLLAKDRQYPKLHNDMSTCNQRHHFMLRMAKSVETLAETEFVGLGPFEGMAMIIEDLDSYLAQHPESEMARSAKKIILHSRTLFLEGGTAELLSRREQNPEYLDIYYQDVATELAKRNNSDTLLLLGGSHDHAILHGYVSSLFKTYNTGLGIDYHLEKDKVQKLYQTYIIENLPKDIFNKALLKELLSAKLVDARELSEEDKKVLSHLQVEELYATLQELSESPGHFVTSTDPSHDHHMTVHGSCLRNIYLLWLKEDQLKDEYHAFKLAFSKKALLQTEDPALRALAAPAMVRRKKKATSV